MTKPPVPGPAPSPSYEYDSRQKVFLFEANRAIASRESRPKHLITFASEVDLAEIERIRRRSATEDAPSHASFAIRALALALREFPQANRRICRRGIWPFARRQIQKFHGRDVAVSVERDAAGDEGTASLEVVRDADERTPREISATLRALASRDSRADVRRSRFLGLAERLPAWASPLLLRLASRSPRAWTRYWGGAARVSPPNRHGGHEGPGAWTYSIEATFGPVGVRPVVRDLEVVARPTFTLTLHSDRRVLPDVQASAFFKRVVELLERAEDELERPREAAPSPGRD